jgi:hypothetical protein
MLLTMIKQKSEQMYSKKGFEIANLIPNFDFELIQFWQRSICIQCGLVSYQNVPRKEKNLNKHVAGMLSSQS